MKPAEHANSYPPLHRRGIQIRHLTSTMPESNSITYFSDQNDHVLISDNNITTNISSFSHNQPRDHFTVFFNKTSAWFLNNTCPKPTPHFLKASHIPSLPVIELLLFLLYLTIICDIIYVLGLRYIKPKLKLSRRCPSSFPVQKKASYSNQIPKRKRGFLTLDNLWKRLKREAQHLQMLNSQHRTITQNMMETRLQARNLDREKSLGRTKSRKWTDNDHNIDMVRWAARIASDHDPRSK